jgi:hypothetical protein
LLLCVTSLRAGSEAPIGLLSRRDPLVRSGPAIMPDLFAWIGHGTARVRCPSCRTGHFFADGGFPWRRRRDEDVATGQRTAACREVPRGRRSVRLRCRGSRSSSVELARRQTRAAGQADPVGR